MKKSDLLDFVGKRVRVSSTVQTNEEHHPIYLYYTGIVLSVNDDTLRLRDKFEKLVVLTNDSITHIAEE